jgi:CheY-like chemotaxis protein
VLIFDPNAATRQILDNTVSEWGMRPAAFESCPESEQWDTIVQSNMGQHALILADSRMVSSIDSAFAEGNIGNRPATLIVMTRPCDDRKALLKTCSAFHCTKFVSKPINPNELWAVLETSLADKLDASRNEDETAIAQTEDATAFRKGSLKVLVADDNPVNQTLALKLLVKRGHHVEVADNGRQAVEAITQQQFDFVLMDVQMPEMNGFEAAREIRSREQTTGEHLPIIALTAHSMQGDREHCLQAGMDAYISKPIDSTEFYATCEAVLMATRE